MIADGWPSHWRKVPLYDESLFMFENGTWTGKNPPLQASAVIRNTNFLDDGLLDLSDVAIISVERRLLARKRLQRGDIIIERSGGGPKQAVGRVALFDLPEGDYCFSNFTSRLRIRDRERLDPTYLHLFLHYCHLTGLTEMLQRRTTGIRNLDFTGYKKILVPIPPLPEQRAIARGLRAVRQAKEARRREAALERERKAALMEHLFTHGTRGEATKQTELGEMPESWKLVRLGELADFLQYGTSQRCDADDSGIPVLRIPNIIGGKIDYSDLKFIKFTEAEAESLMLCRGDLLFVRTNGRREYVGRCAMFGDESRKVLFASYLIRARLSPGRLLPEFAQIYTMSAQGRSEFSNRASNAADGKFNINTQTIRSVMLPLPPVEEQARLVEVLQACEAKIATLEREVTLLDELFRALLEELMTGRLSAVPLIENAEGGGA